MSIYFYIQLDIFGDQKKWNNNWKKSQIFLTSRTLDFVHILSTHNVWLDMQKRKQCWTVKIYLKWFIKTNDIYVGCSVWLTWIACYSNSRARVFPYYLGKLYSHSHDRHSKFSGHFSKIFFILQDRGKRIKYQQK